MVSMDWERARHQHRKAQLLYSVRGVINCEIEDGVWIVPPQCAVDGGAGVGLRKCQWVRHYVPQGSK